MVTKKKKLRNRQRSAQKGKTMTACNTPPDASRDGLDINNRATIAPNNSKTMTENFMVATTTNVATDYTVTTEEINGVVQESGEDASCVKPEAAAPDPFDPANLRLDQEHSDVAVKKVITSIPCKKPGSQDFVRTRPGNWSLDTVVAEDKTSRDYYVVSPELHSHVVRDGFRARLTLAVTRSGDLFLWLQKLPSPDGRTCRWNDSMLVAAQLAETKWVRVVSNMDAGCYDVFEAAGINVEPQWTELSFPEILRLCFKDRFINSLDHPFLRRLRGEV